MSYLLYSSDEMFSSTQLIRQSKSIFDKVSTKDIEKAIILRDGKPTFILFDFKEYEKIMKEYTYFKANYSTNYDTENKIETINQTKTQTTILNKDSIEIQTKKSSRNETATDVVEPHLDDFIVELDDDSIDIANGEIKEFWNK